MLQSKQLNPGNWFYQHILLTSSTLTIERSMYSLNNLFALLVLPHLPAL